MDPDFLVFDMVILKIFHKNFRFFWHEALENITENSWFFFCFVKDSYSLKFYHKFTIDKTNGPRNNNLSMLSRSPWKEVRKITQILSSRRFLIFCQRFLLTKIQSQFHNCFIKWSSHFWQGVLEKKNSKNLEFVILVKIRVFHAEKKNLNKSEFVGQKNPW